MDLGGGVRVYVTFPGLARLPSPPRVNVFLGLVRRYNLLHGSAMWMFLGSLKPCQCLDLISVLRFCRLQHRSSEHRHVVVVVVCLPGASSLPTSAVHNHWAHGPISPAAHTRLARAGLDCRLPPFWREMDAAGRAATLQPTNHMHPDLGVQRK